MPWNVTAAEIEWTGVLFDRDKCRTFLDASTRARERIAIELQVHGITKPGSTHQLCTLLKANRLDHHFLKTKLGRPRTRDQDLKDREHLHPAISLVRRWRKVGQLAADPAVQGLITGVDGRVHSDFMVLGADSGRTQSRRPNLMGIGRAFRPLVCATEGHGVGEVDLAQIEVGIAAAVFRDEAMIADFNGGDVYVATAKRVFKHQILDEDLRLSDREFREKYPQLRDQSKPLVLGIIYGKTVHGIAIDLKISRGEAQSLWDTFRSLYPILCDGMERGEPSQFAGATPTSQDYADSGREQVRPRHMRSVEWAMRTSRVRPPWSSSTQATGCDACTDSMRSADYSGPRRVRLRGPGRPGGEGGGTDEVRAGPDCPGMVPGSSAPDSGEHRASRMLEPRGAP